MDFAMRLDDHPGKPSAIHNLGDDVLLYVYKEATDIEVSEEFIELIERELERRNLLSHV